MGAQNLKFLNLIVLQSDYMNTAGKAEVELQSVAIGAENFQPSHTCIVAGVCVVRKSIHV
jgi:hypothetical protein